MTEMNSGQLDNPFPGLRPFEPSETHLFFGREGQSDELARLLTRNRFVAVVGTSGKREIVAGQGWNVAGACERLHRGRVELARGHLTTRSGSDRGAGSGARFIEGVTARRYRCARMAEYAGSEPSKE